jgi:uncharacterized protein DUF397
MSPQSADSSRHDVTEFSGTPWRRSSRCAVNGSCVEVTKLPSGQVGVRDGKIGAASPVLAFSRTQWRAFLSSMLAGKFPAS